MDKTVKSILFSVLVAGSVFGYNHFTKPSPANLAYQKFAEAMARGNVAEAQALATDEEEKEVERLLAPEQYRGSDKPFTNSFAEDSERMFSEAARELEDKKRAMRNSIQKVTYKIESEETSDTKSSIVAVQTLHRGDIKNRLSNKAELVKEGDYWKVSSYEEKFLNPGQ